MPHVSIGYNNFLNNLKKVARETRKSGEKWQADEREDFINYYEPMNHFALGKGLKTFAVDHPFFSRTIWS
jgi:hypothetical protein